MTAPAIIRIVSADDIRHGPFEGWVDVVRELLPTLPPPTKGQGGGYRISEPPVVARVNQGRWIADCPSQWCNGAEYVGPQENLFWCGSCGEGVHQVTFPGDVAAIEAVLGTRPHADFASWEPGISLEELREAGPFHRSWTTPRTWITAEIVTASVGNTHWRDNLLQTAPAKAATAGDAFYATGANALAVLAASGNALKFLRMNTGETALEYAAPGPTTFLQDLRDNIALLCLSDFGGSGDDLGDPSNADTIDFGLITFIESGASWTQSGDKTGGAVKFRSGATADRQVGVTSAKGAEAQHDPHFATKLQTSAGAAALKAVLWGFFGAANADISLATSTSQHKAMFRQVTTGEVFYVTGNAGGEETTDLSGSVTKGNEYEFRSETKDAGVTWKGYVVGTERASHTTTLPTTTTGMAAVIGIENNTTTIVELDKIDFVYAYQNRD